MTFDCQSLIHAFKWHIVWFFPGYSRMHRDHLLSHMLIPLSKHLWMSVCLLFHPWPHLFACDGFHGHPPSPSLFVDPHDVVLSHWVFGRSQDHSGALMAEEFKACLISLGYDVENDKQVGAPGLEAEKRDGVCQTSEQEHNQNVPFNRH